MRLSCIKKRGTPVSKNFHLFLGIILLAITCCGAEDKNPKAEGEEQKPRPLHPAFSLDRESLSRLISVLPAQNQEAILAAPRQFLDEMGRLLLDSEFYFQVPEGLLVLVDKKNPLPEGWEPRDLVSLKDYPSLNLSRQNLQMRGLVMEDLLAMNEAAKAEGVSLLLSSTYRSAAYQKTVYERNVREMGQAAADRESSRPRHSQHQLGTVIDFGSIDDNFTGTKMERWLDANAWKYGFSLSFPEGYESVTGYRYESWHFRYLGPPAAALCRKFFGNIQQIMLEFFSSRGGDFAAAFTP
jgi:D-alanyl-D-alanine carboxypeptidase